MKSIMATAFIRSCFMATLVLVLAASTLPSVPVLAADFPLSPDDGVITNALDYLRQVQGADGNIGGFAISAWVVMAVAAAGEDPNEWGEPSIVDYLRDNSDNLDWNKATDLERSILAITAAEENPTNFGGHDYVGQLKTLYDGEQIGYDDTLNDDFWGVLALISAGESPSSEIIQNTCDFVKTNQNFDGGWNWEVGGDSDVDDTAAVIMALIAAGESPESDAIIWGLTFLMYSQNYDGGFPSLFGGASNSASDSWAIGALVAAGEDMEDWVGQGGDDPADNLISLQDSDGSFKRTADQTANPEFMTAYAIPALLGVPYPVKVPSEQQPELPDLSVTDIDVPNTIYTDTETTVTATIENIGEEDIADSFRVRLYADGASIDTATVGELDAGDSVDVDLEWTPDEAGDYTLKVITDLDDDIDESNENNNKNTLEVEVEERPEAPDLIVTDIDVPNTIYTDTEATVTATIKNTGGEDITDSFRIRLYADGDSVDTATVGELDASDSVDVDLEWTPTEAGDYTLKVITDLDDDIDESRETNNTLTTEVTVTTASSSSPEDPSPAMPPPEESPTAILPVISVKIEPSQIDFGDLALGETSSDYTITITNNGNQDIVVTAEVDGDAQDFYTTTLKLNDWSWDVFRLVIPQKSSEVIRARLCIPQSYSGQIMEGGTITFWTDYGRRQPHILDNVSSLNSCPG